MSIGDRFVRPKPGLKAPCILCGENGEDQVDGCSKSLQSSKKNAIDKILAWQGSSLRPQAPDRILLSVDEKLKSSVLPLCQSCFGLIDQIDMLEDKMVKLLRDFWFLLDKRSNGEAGKEKHSSSSNETPGIRVKNLRELGAALVEVQVKEENDADSWDFQESCSQVENEAGRENEDKSWESQHKLDAAANVMVKMEELSDGVPAPPSAKAVVGSNVLRSGVSVTNRKYQSKRVKAINVFTREMEGVFSSDLWFRPQECRICCCQVDSLAALLDHVKVDHPEQPPFVCHFCVSGWSDPRDYVVHVLFEELEIAAKRNFWCKACNQVFRSPRLLATHFAEEHQDVSSRFFPFDCSKCKGMSFETFESYVEHRQSPLPSHDEELKAPVRTKRVELGCPECRGSYFAPNDVILQQHCLKAHGIVHSFNCPRCNDKFETINQLGLHFIKSEFSLDTICTVCEVHFASSGELEAHMECSHPLQDVYGVRRTFSSSHSLKVHKERTKYAPTPKKMLHRQGSKPRSVLSMPSLVLNRVGRPEKKPLPGGTMPVRVTYSKKPKSLKRTVDEDHEEEDLNPSLSLTTPPKRSLTFADHPVVRATYTRLSAKTRASDPRVPSQGAEQGGWGPDKQPRRTGNFTLKAVYEGTMEFFSEHVLGVVGSSQWFKPRECRVCHKNFSFVKSMVLHCHSTHPDSEPFVCHFCLAGFRSPKDYVTHIMYEELTRSQQGSFSCYACNKDMYSPRMLCDHFEEHHSCKGEEPFSCFECNLKFTNFQAFIDHRQGYYSPHQLVTQTVRREEFRCKSCDLSFDDEQGFLDHSAAAHKDSHPFACPRCEKKDKNLLFLGKHMITYEMNALKTCQFCEIVFTSKDRKRHHVQSAHGGRLYECKKCGECYRVRRYGEEHEEKCQGKNQRIVSNDIQQLWEDEEEEGEDEAVEEEEGEDEVVEEEEEEEEEGDNDVQEEEEEEKAVGVGGGEKIVTCRYCQSSTVDLKEHIQACHPEKVSVIDAKVERGLWDHSNEVPFGRSGADDDRHFRAAIATFGLPNFLVGSIADGIRASPSLNKLSKEGSSGSK